MKYNKIVFGKPNFNNQELENVKDVLKSGWVGTGKITEKFEKIF